MQILICLFTNLYKTGFFFYCILIFIIIITIQYFVIFAELLFCILAGVCVYVC